MVEEISNQCFGWILVLSMLMTCVAVTSQNSFTCGTKPSSSSEVISGFKPSALRFEAMVPPVAIIRIRLRFFFWVFIMGLTSCNKKLVRFLNMLYHCIISLYKKKGKE